MPTLPHLMRRAWLPHDVVAAAWRTAVEFSRPTRTSASRTSGALALMPSLLLVAAISRVYVARDHRRRVVAAVGVKRAGLRGLALPFVAALLLAWAAIEGADAAGLSPPGWVVAAAAVGLVALVLHALLGKRRARRHGLELDPLPREPAGPKADWVLVTAAARPGLGGPGVRAMDILFVPHLRRVLPAGATVKLTARNRALAHRYATYGFQRRTERELDLYREV